MKMRLAHDNADDFPTDIAPFSIHDAEQEWVFPPGTYLEQKKEWTETMAGVLPGDNAGDQAKIVEIAPYIPAVRRTATVKAKEKAVEK